MSRRAFIVCDLGFGDAGKGSLTDYLVRNYAAGLVVRYNGGPQAGHNVITPEGKHHCFSQFGAGTLAGAYTYLSRHMLVNPMNMLVEAERLMDLGVPKPMERVAIDGEARIITPYQRSFGRLLELSRESKRHGSCGEGVGETRSDELRFGPDFVLTMRELGGPDLVSKLETIRVTKLDEVNQLDLPRRDGQVQAELDALAEPADCVAEIYRVFDQLATVGNDETLYDLLNVHLSTVVFEGAQGVLLDERFGFHPHTTWTNTTMDNALSCLHGYQGDIIRLGVMRAYTVRHGAGPFPTQAARIGFNEIHNVTNDWQEHFRAGPFDHMLHRYAAEVAGPFDYVAVGHFDQLGPQFRSCVAYRVPEPYGRYFEHGDAGYARRIRVPLRHTTNLAWQAELGEALRHVEPYYMHWDESSLQDYVETLASTVRAPIGITSTGPEAKDKQQFLAWRQRVA